MMYQMKDFAVVDPPPYPCESGEYRTIYMIDPLSLPDQAKHISGIVTSVNQYGVYIKYVVSDQDHLHFFTWEFIKEIV